jgi:uncharacterized repeat protein (TIGR01451 family)
MRARNIALIVALGIIAVASHTYGQEGTVQDKGNSFFDKLDSVGKSIFGGILPAEKPKAKGEAKVELPSRQAMRKPGQRDPFAQYDVQRTDDQRAGSVLGRSDTSPRALADEALARDSNDIMPEDELLKPERRPLAASTEVATADKVALPPLHTRLSTFRQSVFGPKSAGESKTATASQPQEASEPATEVAAENETSKSMQSVESARPTDEPTLARRVKPANEVEKAAPASAGNVLITRKGPILSVETLGPRKIAVGKESKYDVNILNSGEVAAEDLVVFVSLPEWAEVAGTEPGGVGSQTPGTVRWNVGRLEANGRRRLTLRIVPRQTRPFDLAVRWDYKPVASQAMIEVQEPKLELRLEGPREVLFGKKETYRLKLSNAGNGAAENVAVMMLPLGGSENLPATHKVGSLSAGEEKVLEVELTARQAGNLTIQVDVRADSGVHAELAEKVLVRKADLAIEVEGPKVQYVGAATTYVIYVRNPGTAPAKNVKLTAVLPAGVKYVSGIEGAALDSSGSKLDWNVDAIGPEGQQSFVLKCRMGAAGAGTVQVSAAGEDELVASAAAVTRIEAAANLVMEVDGPEGPVVVGEEATYQVRVRNRGSKESQGVEVFAYFSRGIEPTGAEGRPNRLGPGQVTFQPISTLAPGAEVTLKIRARADEAGNHVFRAEAHCVPLGTRLISEATNLYYSDTGASAKTAQSPGSEPSVSGLLRTVTRPMPGILPPAPPLE